MSDQDLDYAAIRQNVEKGLHEQRWLYRKIFFGFHLLFFCFSMFVTWGLIAADASLREVIFNSGTPAPALVILPTILWSLVVMFHSAALFVESNASEKVIRQRLLMREAGEEILRKGMVNASTLEKPKRRATSTARLSDDGEQIALDDLIDERDRRIIG